MSLDKLKPPSTRRIRVGSCPHCGALNQIARKLPGDDIALTCCTNFTCYRVFDGAAIETRLESPEVLHERP